MVPVELTDDEIEVVEMYRTAQLSKDADIQISVKNGHLAKVYITKKQHYDPKGSLKERKE